MQVDFIKTERNKYAIQVVDDPNVDSKWGFYLTDGSSAWDGGLSCGLGSQWIIIDFEQIPKRYTRIRKRLQEIKTEIESGLALVNLNRRNNDLN